MRRKGVGRRSGLAGGLIAILLGASHAAAQEPATTIAPLAPRFAGVVWHCWYGNLPEYATCFRLTGIARRDGADVTEEAIHTMAGELLRTGNIIAATRVFRRFPESFTGITRHVPLYTIPFDLESVARLTQSVMCARVREPCAVAFDLRWSADETRPPPFTFSRGRPSQPY